MKKTNQPDELLEEISTLLEKYGRETFIELVGKLKSEEGSEHIIAVLEAVLKADQRNQPKVESKQELRAFRSKLVESQKTEPEKYKLLTRVFDELLAKLILPTLQDIQNLAGKFGLPSIEAVSQNRAIIPLIKVLSQLDMSELQDIVSTIERVDKQDDRSLKGWSDIILDE